MKNVDHWFILIEFALRHFRLCLRHLGQRAFSSRRICTPHINLIGFASMVLFGLLYRAFPALATSKLAAVHFILFNLGAVVFLVGIPLAQAHQTVAFAAGGSLTVLAGMLTFLANYLVNAFSGSASVRART
jgi:cbb3-type cytochrome oxidase subunit 1